MLLKAADPGKVAPAIRKTAQIYRDPRNLDDLLGISPEGTRRNLKRFHCVEALSLGDNLLTYVDARPPPPLRHHDHLRCFSTEFQKESPVLSSKLPAYLSGFAIALLAGAFLVLPLPAQAQSTDDDVTYASPDQQQNDAIAPQDDDDASLDEEVLPPTADDDNGEDRRDDDRQDFARSEEESRCIAEFRSFDPVSGTYTTEDGERMKCPYLF